MSIETILKDLATAVEANTEVQKSILAKLNGSAATAPAAEEEPKAKGGRPPKQTTAKKEDAPAAEQKEEAPAKEAAAKKAPAAAKKTPAAKKAAEITPRDEIDAASLKTVAKEYLTGAADADDKAKRRGNLAAAFAHLGAENLTGVESEHDMRRMALYLDNWLAGNEVNFEQADEIVGGSEDSNGEEDGDDEMLG